VGGADERWEVLERIGAYVAGELFGEEARQAERFVLENAKGQRLADSYARLLALLIAVGEETSEPPRAIVERAVRWAAESGDRRNRS
jgi:hypothetical protein